MMNTSLVFGTRRYGCHSVLVGLVASCAISVHAAAPDPQGRSSLSAQSHDRPTHASVHSDTTMAEPLSLLFLGTGLVAVASRLRRFMSKA